MSLIALSGVGVEFGATTLFKDITFTIARGDRWGVVGRNGSGKTTLFKLITDTRPTSRKHTVEHRGHSQVALAGRGLRAPFLPPHRSSRLRVIDAPC